MSQTMPLLHQQPFLSEALSHMTICDIGAALLDGEQPAYLPFINSNKATLIAAEPDQNALPALREKFPAPHRIIDKAIGKGGPATLHVTNYGYTSSLYEPNLALMEKFQSLAEFCQVVEQKSIDTVRLDDVLGGDKPDFLKIDIQGAELDVFDGAPDALNSILVVQTEVEFLELYKNQPLFADVDTALRRAGFQFHTFLGASSRCYKPVNLPNSGSQGVRQLLWGDAVYFRSVETWPSMETADLIKMAVILQDLYQSFDVVAAILQMLDQRDGSDLAQPFFRSVASR